MIKDKVLSAAVQNVKMENGRNPCYIWYFMLYIDFFFLEENTRKSKKDHSLACNSLTEAHLAAFKTVLKSWNENVAGRVSETHRQVAKHFGSGDL